MDTYICSNCGASLDASMDTDSRRPCDICGVTSREQSVNMIETIKLHDIYKGKIIDPSLPSKKKTRIEFFQGAELRKKDGKMLKKERLIDKKNNLYREILTDPDTGEILHYTEEPLSEHRGHGTAKKV